MEKTLDLSRSVHDLAQEYPEFPQVMAGIGFTDITKPAALNTVGRVTTVPRGCAIKGISLDDAIRAFTGQDSPGKDVESISGNVSDLLDELLDHSVRLIGKPTALMSKDEKMRAIRFLDERGAFLVTKSGPKICQFFGISTYTLYSYLDEIRKTADQE